MVTDIFLHGDGSENFAVGVITVNKDRLIEFALEHQIEKPVEELYHDKQIRTLICKELNIIGKKEGLHGFEQARNIYIEPEVTFMNKGILSNTLKMQRHKARTIYAEQIRDMYKEGQL